MVAFAVAWQCGQCAAMGKTSEEHVNLVVAGPVPAQEHSACLIGVELYPPVVLQKKSAATDSCRQA